MLDPLAPGLWELNDPLSVFGMELGHRMTVVRLPDGSLWLHSPVAFSAELAAELAAIGPVSHVVAPNCVHDTYLEEWFAACPSAHFHGAPGFARIRPDLKFTATLGDAVLPAWADMFDQHVVAGMPRVNEVVFLHHPTRTLIITDLAFNLGPDLPLLTRALLRVNGSYNRFACSRLLRSTMRDRAAVRASIDKILAWEFDRIVLSHGRNVDVGGKRLLREAYSFL